MTSQKGDVSGGPGMSPGMTSAVGGPFVIFLVLNIGCGLCKCQGQASPLFGQLSKALFRSTENALVRYQSALKGFRSSCGGLGGHQMAR